MASSRKKKRTGAKVKKPARRKVSHKKASKPRRKTPKRKPRNTRPRARAKSVAEVVAFVKAQIASSSAPPAGAHFPLAVLVSLLKPTPVAIILSALQELDAAGVITQQPDNSFVVNPVPATP